MNLAKSSDSSFAPGSFDYIFHRLLVLGMTDWPGYVSTVGSLLRPGGWAEMQDFDINIRGADGKSISEDWNFYHYFIEDCKAIGLDIQAGSQLGSRMRNAGVFCDIEDMFYKMPMKYTPEIPEGELMAKLNEKVMAVSSQALVRRVCGGRRSAEDVEKFVIEVKERFDATKPEEHSRFYVVTGQKVE